LLRLATHESLSRETVCRRLAENALKPRREEMWYMPEVDGEFVARLEDVLDLDAEPPEGPVVRLDENPIQRIRELREPMAAEPGQLQRYAGFSLRAACRPPLRSMASSLRPVWLSSIR
jgi:hypothetical protein